MLSVVLLCIYPGVTVLKYIKFYVKKGMISHAVSVSVC